MAFIGKQVTVNGVIYTPLSADPSNPKEGQQYFSDGTVRARGLWVYKDSNWSQVGSGVSDKSVYAQFDAEDQSVTGFTNISVSGSGAINEDNSYVVDSFPASIPAATLNPRNKNKENSVEFQYTLASGTAKAVVKDQTATVLEEVELESSTNAQKVVLSYYITGTMSEITLEFQDVSSATSLKVDDIIFSDDPFVYKNIQEENVFSASIANNGTATITSQSSEFIQSVSRTSAGQVLVTFVPGFFTVAPSIAFGERDNRTTGLLSGAITTTGFTAANRNSGTLTDNEFNFVVQRQGADYKPVAEHVITPAKSSETVNQALSADVTSSGDVADLQFNNLVVGQKYLLTGTVRIRSTSSGNPRLDFYSGASATGTLYGSTSQTGNASVNLENNFAVSIMFTAESTTMYSRANAAGSSIIRGNNDKSETHLQLTNVTAQFLAAIPVDQYQTKILPSNVSSTGIVSDLSFSNLAIGKVYEIKVNLGVESNDTGNNTKQIILALNNGATQLDEFQFRNVDQIIANEPIKYSTIFTATDSNVTFDITSLTRMQLQGDGTRVKSYVQIIEKNTTKETTRF